MFSLQKNIKQFEKTFAKSGRKLNELYQEHADNRDEALALPDELNAAWQRSQEHAFDARFELRDKMTEDEWSKLCRRDDQ